MRIGVETYELTGMIGGPVITYVDSNYPAINNSGGILSSRVNLIDPSEISSGSADRKWHESYNRSVLRNRRDYGAIESEQLSRSFLEVFNSTKD